ncbi:MAG: lytic murein transglycosylase [Proteobacteria bacterium]|nr:lytic murein transglycosylase [Pseudomonadota bacterium]
MARALLMAVLAATAIACNSNFVRAQTVQAPTFATSGNADFDGWRDDFAARAVAQGRDPAVLRRLLSGISPDPSIVTLDQQQPEFVSPVWDYVNNRVTDRRIAAGQAMKASMGSTLTQIQQRYGVDADIVLGIWALESNLGQAPLNYTAPEALATLAYEGRRRAQFENYLLALCQMVERGLATPDELRSSWAGAMGQPQFMPDVYLTLAVDWDGDGKRDIWTNNADVAASIANYLQNKGWRAGEPVFDEVRLPTGFDFSLADGSTRSVSDWEGLGVRRVDGGAWSVTDRTLQSQLFLPAGANGPALLLHPNFAVIRRYNNSDRYALVVALLARAFEGRGGLVASWPTQVGSLNRDQTLELQTLLNSLGYNSGTPDGLFGSGTRRAVRAFQTDQHLAADGFPTADLLNQVRARAGVSVDPPASSSSEGPRALDARGVRELQRLLKRMGYRLGAADGSIGPATRTAIRSFQRRRHMDVTGRATSDVLEQARRAAR